MNIKSIFKNIFQKSQGQIYDLDVNGKPSFWSAKGWDFSFNNDGGVSQYLNEAYTNPYFFAVIDRISNLASMLDRDLLYKDDSEKEVNEIELSKLLEQPNERDSNQEFYYRINANYLTCGEVFIVGINPIGFRTYSELIVPTTSNVTINVDKDGQAVNYTIDYFNTTITLEKENVLHIYKPNIICDSLNGLSNLNAARKVYQSNNEVWASEASLHKNKGISGVLFADGNKVLRPQEQRDLQQQYDADYTGTDKFGKVKVSTTKLGYLQMGMNPNDLKSIETRIEHLRTACALFAVSSQLFGDTAASTYNNMQEAKRAMYIDAIIPLAEKIDRELSKWLINDNFALEGIEIKVDTDEIEVLHEVDNALSAKVMAEFAGGLLTQEQALDILYPDLEIALPIGEILNTGDSLAGDPAAIDANAEAQARLRGSVGGVQGILAIQASVSQGITPRSSALATLIEIYGFDNATANRILG